MFDQKGRRAAHFAPGGEALQHPTAQNQQRRANADRTVGRSKGDDGRAHGHGHNGQRQSGLAPYPIAIDADDQRPQRPNHKTETKS